MTTQRCDDGIFDCSSTPLRVSGDVAFVRLGGSASSSCGLTAAGKAWCWGLGELGDGQPIRKSVVPVAVAGGHTFSLLAVSLNNATACGLEVDRSLWCWGGGLVGPLGLGPQASALPVRWDKAASVAWTQFSLGEQHACGLDDKGQAWCIGSNWFHTLGNGDSADSAVPVPVAGGHMYREIAAGSMHTCALDIDGQAWCWGAGAAVGDGALSGVRSRNVPVAVAGNLRFSQITSGWSTSCGLTADLPRTAAPGAGVSSARMSATVRRGSVARRQLPSLGASNFASPRRGRHYLWHCPGWHGLLLGRQQGWRGGHAHRRSVRGTRHLFPPCDAVVQKIQQVLVSDERGRAGDTNRQMTAKRRASM